MWLFRTRIGLWVVVMLTACGSGGEGGAGTAANDIIVTYTRSGGFTGGTDKLTVHADGALTLTTDTRTKTARAEEAKVRALQQTLANAEWSNLEASYGKQVPDGYAYTIVAGDKTVQTYDGATNPAVLDQVIQDLNGLLALASQS